MTDSQPASRRERRAAEREHLHEAAGRRGQRRGARERRARDARVRKLAFGATVLAVLVVGAALAFGDFFDRPNGASAASTGIDIQSSMAGFTPSEIRVTAGETVALNWWTDDAAPHLQGGVHTMVSPDLDLYEELPAESNRAIAWTVPNKPGTYDVWCETCCGGKDSPTMHGTITVEPPVSA